MYGILRQGIMCGLILLIYIWIPGYSSPFGLRPRMTERRGISGLKAEYDSSWEMRGLENDRGGEKVTVWEREKILQYFAT